MIRTVYLAALMVLLFIMILGGSTTRSLRELAQAGATAFQGISYLQVGLICLLTPVFMAGAIAQEANPRTWDILLTTPLNSLQIVLGNLFGRLFFVLALLFSTLPLFAVTQYFGGVPGNSIFASYAIAGTSSLLVASIAVTLSVTRTAGRRAVFAFYAIVILYLFATYAIDLQLRTPIGTGSQEHTTILTPINPFLALSVLLQSNVYVPHSFVTGEAGWLERMWMGRPIASFCWLCVAISLVLIIFATARLRVIGTRVGTIPWHRKLFRISSATMMERAPRKVSKNPVAWREAVARGGSIKSILVRWGFVVVGTAIGLTMIVLFHIGQFDIPQMRLYFGALVAAEIVLIVLAALNTSATAVSREREDGSLDLILTTPIQPGPYLAGKLRGLIQFLFPMMLVPVLSVIFISIYVLADGFGREGGIVTSDNLAGSSTRINVPIMLPAGGIALPLMLVPFIAFCVMVGLQWSIKSKGTIGSIVASVAIVLIVVGVLSMCGFAAGNTISIVGAVISTLSPINLIMILSDPAGRISGTLESSHGSSLGVANASIIFGALAAGFVYSLVVYGMLTNMKRTFMMTVRKLAGSN